MKQVRGSLCVLTLLCAGALHAQTPAITGVSAQPFGSNVLCPGDQVVVNGTNLGTVSTVVTVGAKNAFVKSAASNGTQLVVQLPVDAPLGATTIKAGTSAPFNITLSQFAPALLHDGTNVVAGFHLSNGSALSANSPASPGEQIGVAAFGLGPTTPPIATGSSAADFNTVTNTAPTASIAGKSAVVTGSFAGKGQIATYQVILIVRDDASSGFQSLNISMGGFTSNTVFLPVSTAPVVSQIVNAASYTPQSLPGAEIAQGAIFVLKGILMGPTNIAVAANPFQVTTLATTTVNIQTGGSSIPLPLYYTVAGQVAGLLPSSIPKGPANLTVTYNGQTGASFPFTVVANQLGIFTTSSDGGGAGIVTYPDYSLVSVSKAANCGGPGTTCGAANAGDVLTLWATGLGPISGNDVKGDGLGVDMANLPLKLFIGGVQANVLFRGRGCCVGEDQIAFTVPDKTPTGCAVPLYVQIGNTLSNFVLIPVAVGSRTCAGSAEPLTPSNVAAITSGAPIAIGDMHLARRSTAPGYEDLFFANFFKGTFKQSLAPFLVTYLDRIPLGACMVYPKLGSGFDAPFDSGVGLDAGSKLTIKGPNGTVTASPSGNDSYAATLSSKATFLTSGTYTISAPGGTDVSAFSVDYTVPALPVLTSPAPDNSSAAVVTRANGMTINWSGGSAGTYVELLVSSATDNNFNSGASVDCLADSTLHTFTIPAGLLAALPATNFAALDLIATPATLVGTATGLNVVILGSEFHSVSQLNVK